MNVSYLNALFGGVMIGLAAAGLLWSNGKILGVSGIVGRLFKARSWELYWRVTFLVGMFLGAFLIEPIGYSVMTQSIDRSLVLVGLGGLLVGFGTTVGNGCTSGHGVCGVSRLSPRSIVATLVFMTFGIISVGVIHHIL